METIPATHRLYERQPAPAESLVPALARVYDGGLAFRSGTAGRPYVVANFVETLDGVTSYDEAGEQGGGAISGEQRADHALMGILRAFADAVIFGAGSLRVEAGHIHTPAFIFPELAGAYTEQRARLGKRAAEPLSVVLTASGALPLDEPTFTTPGVRALIATTAAGRERLANRALPPSTDLRALPADGTGGVDPLALLDLLAREYDVSLALHEGGPTSLGAFLRSGALDELFLTLAPQFAGRSATIHRPALIEQLAYRPATAPWATLATVHAADSHLFLRYQIAGAHEQTR